MYSVSKTFEFEASHKLVLDYDSPCSNLHGHSYKVAIEITSDKLDHNGMVLDFTHLKNIKDWVMENWDHSLIVSFKDKDILKLSELNIAKVHEFEGHNVTAELMAHVLSEVTYDKIKDHIDSRDLKRIRIKVWETSNNMAEFSKEY